MFVPAGRYSTKLTVVLGRVLESVAKRELHDPEGSVRIPDWACETVKRLARASGSRRYMMDYLQSSSWSR